MRNFRGMGFARRPRCLQRCNTKAKLARANAVRPYRVLGKYFVISPLILHALRGASFFVKKGLSQKINLTQPLSALLHYRIPYFSIT